MGEGLQMIKHYVFVYTFLQPNARLKVFNRTIKEVLNNVNLMKLNISFLGVRVVGS